MTPGTPPLTNLYFYLTGGCNLACRHCWLAPRLDPLGDRYGALPLDLFEAVIEQARPLGLRGVRLTGGEPLLHPRFTRLLDVVRRERLRLVVETNGTLCTPALAAEIARVPGAAVSVSLDGANAETHEWLRGVPGSFAAATAAVRHLAAVGLQTQVIVTVMRRNAGQVEAMVRLAEALGAASLKVNFVQPVARGERLRALEGLPLSDVLALGRRLYGDLADGTRLRLVTDLPQAFRPLGRMAQGDACSVCGILTALGVLADGQYALCGIGAVVPELTFGGAGRDPLARVWHEHATLRELRAGMPERLEGVCGRCLMRRSCSGHCLAMNYYRSGRLWAPYWLCQEAEREGLFPASRLAMVPAGSPQTIV